jgi:hypothetical protein
VGQPPGAVRPSRRPVPALSVQRPQQAQQPHYDNRQQPHYDNRNKPRDPTTANIRDERRNDRPVTGERDQTSKSARTYSQQ